MKRQTKTKGMVSFKDRNWLRVAQYEASKSPCLHKHGCVIIGGGKLLSRGYNHYNNKHGYSCHAEMDTLRKMPKTKRRRLKLYVVRVGRNQDVKNSKPCPTCALVLKNNPFRSVIFSNEQGGYTKLLTRDL